MSIAIDTRSGLPRIVPQRPRIGEILLASGAITEADLERILTVQREQPELFGQIALRLKLIGERELRRALAQQFEYPIAHPRDSALSEALVVAYDPFCTYAEALRTLRSRLTMRWFGAQESTLAILGTRRDAGCSTLVANLAIVFAQLGQRTLVIDANLREPAQHHLFGLSGSAGLADVLKGRCRADAGLQSIPYFDCLSVLCAGTAPPNPQELLSRLPFTQLLDDLSTRFDVLILDTPPLLEYADAHIIAARARGCVFATRRHGTRLADIGRAKTLLDPDVPHILGVVVSD